MLEIVEGKANGSASCAPVVGEQSPRGTGRLPAWVSAAGKSICYAVALTEVETRASLRPFGDLRVHDAGSMLPSDPS